MLGRHRILALSLLPALAAGKAIAAPSRIVAPETNVQIGAPALTPLASTVDPFAPSIALARLAGVLEVIPTAVVDELVRWQLAGRDLLHGAADSLLATAASIGAPYADLTVLTTSPIAAMTLEESSGFGWREDPVNHRDRRFHRGTDFRAKHGTPVVVAGDGVVVFAGQQSGYGNVIYVDHGGGVVTRYAHLSRIETKKQTAVTAGTEIGKVGATGRVTGPHLHFEIRLDGNAVDPVLGMSVAALERDAPAAGQLAAYALAPELQAKKLDGEDRSNRNRREVTPASRPERAGHVKRTQALW